MRRHWTYAAMAGLAGVALVGCGGSGSDFFTDRVDGSWGGFTEFRNNLGVRQERGTLDFRVSNTGIVNGTIFRSDRSERATITGTAQRRDDRWFFVLQYRWRDTGVRRAEGYVTRFGNRIETTNRNGESDGLSTTSNNRPAGRLFFDLDRLRD